MTQDNNFNILYVEFPGWCVVSNRYDITFVDTVTSALGSTIYAVDWTDSGDWYTGINFNYVGSTFRIFTDDGGETLSGRYMCVGTSPTGTEAYMQYVDGDTITPTTDSVIELEDNYRICTHIPDWVTGSDSRARWIPIIADVTSTISQQIKPEGGIAPVNGFTLSCVNDNTYEAYVKGTRSYPRIENFLLQDSIVNYATYDVLGQERIHVTEEALTPSIALASIQGSTELGPLEITGLVEDDYIDCPWLNLEAVIVVETTGGITTLDRGRNNTLALSHPLNSVLYKRIPSVFGANCTVYSTSDSSWEVNYDTLYYGLVENIVFGSNLTQFDIELSSVLFTGRVSSLFAKSPSSITRSVKVRGLGSSLAIEQSVYPGLPDTLLSGSDTREGGFYGRYFVMQENPEESFSWVRIGNLAVSMRKISIPFEDFNPDTPGDTLLQLYGLKTDPQSRIQYVNDQILTGKYYVFYMAVPYIIDSRNFAAGARPSPYIPRSTSFKVSNILRLDNIESEVISPLEEVLDDIINLTTDRFWNKYDADNVSLLNSLTRTYMSEQSIRLCHVFDKTLTEDARTVLGFAYVEVVDPDNFDEVINSEFENQRAQYNRVHIVDVMLQLLTSTGGGNNGPFDVLPSEFGLGINYEFIDVESFRTFSFSNRGYTLSNAYIDTEKSDVGKYLEDFILKPNFLALAQGLDGKVKLVDLVNLIIDPANPAPNYTEFLVYEEDITGFNIGLEYNSQYLANNIKLSWKETWAPRNSPRRNLSVDIRQGGSDGANGFIANVTNIYQRLRQEPIIIDYDYAPVGNLIYYQDSRTYPFSSADQRPYILDRASQYVNLYKKPVPILTFTLDTMVAVPLTIGDIGRFLSVPIPIVSGGSSIVNTVTIFKVIEAQYDYTRKVCLYKAIILSELRVPSISRWHLTAKVTGVTLLSGTYTITLQPQYGVTNETGVYLEPTDWATDSAQFNAGDTIEVLNSSYTSKGPLLLTGRASNVITTTQDASGVVVGDIIIAETVSTINSVYAPSLLGIEFNKLN